MVACEVMPTDGDPYGQINTASLTMKGPIIDANRFLMHQDFGHFWQDCQKDSYPFEIESGFAFDIHSPSEAFENFESSEFLEYTTVFQNVFFFQILSHSSIYSFNAGKPDIVWMLMLVETEESGVYRRVGRAHFLFKGNVAEKGWDTRTISII